MALSQAQRAAIDPAAPLRVWEAKKLTAAAMDSALKPHLKTRSGSSGLWTLPPHSDRASTPRALGGA